MKKTISLVLVLVLDLIASVANADFVWGTAVNLGPNVNSSSNDAGASISADGLTLYFSSNRSGGAGGYDLWCTTRATINDDWGPAENLGQPPNSRYSYWEPSISSDGLTLYFSDGHSPQYGNRLPGGLGGQGDIWMVTRASLKDSWGEPINLGSAVNSQHAIHPCISSDSLSLYFQTHRPGALGHCDIMVATRKSTSDSFGDPVFLKNVNAGGADWTPDISADGLTLFLMRNPGPPEIWASTRRTTDDDFGARFKLPHQVNMPGYDNGIPNLSADGSTLYFLSNRPGGFGGWDLWQVSIEPIVDINTDGIVDSIDMCMMVDNWGTDEPLYDVAPAPFGDNIVDVKDLIVLAEHLFEDNRLVAHWALDETEGIIAKDSTGYNDAYIIGDSLWQPAEGKKDGALQLDGIDDYVVSMSVLNPADGPFSVFAWIKGGVPGQVVISQMDGAGTGETWLGMDTVSGCLMTGLVPPPAGRFVAQPLSSQTVVADGLWHHVGFVWDGLYRTLYVDGTEVATDATALAPLNFSNGGLYIGTNKILDEGCFFSGLIDDVRIYDVALTTEDIQVLAQ
ncbi:MAG: LamG-like jellyroll fold domain-containing protein [Planctomycetota bacterium]|jgi:Tol biopolymer transport system component